MRVEVNGEWVSTCAGFELQHAKRSVALIGFTEYELEKMLYKGLGYERGDPNAQEEVRTIAVRLATNAANAHSTYRFSIFHFPPASLHFTDKMVRFATRTASGMVIPVSNIWPSVPAALVRARTLAVINGASPAEALALQLPGDGVARLDPAKRDVRTVGKRLVESLAGSPPPKPDGKAGRSEDTTSIRTAKANRVKSRLDELLESGHAAGEEVRRLGEELGNEAEHTSQLEVKVRELMAQLELSNRQADALRAAAEQHSKQVREALADCEGAKAAAARARLDIEHAKAGAAEFTPWHTRMLADTKGLGKLIRQLTTFRSLRAFRAFFDVILDCQGCTRTGRAGITARLDYWYAPKHAKAPAADAAAVDGRWAQQLNLNKPGGLSSPSEACFMTMAMLRLGLHLDETAILFNISTGSASQIFNTWVPFISRSLKAWTPWPTGAQVAANLPGKFKQKLARTTHSQRCRIIIDATEIEVQVVEDDNIRKLFYSQYKGRCTIKYLIGVTPCGSIAFVSDGYPGSISDDDIVRESGLLDMLDRGDAIMADRGFTDWTSLRDCGLELIIPALSHAKGKGEGRDRAEFTKEENERTYRVANVRIHVERMMRATKAGWGCFDAPIVPQRFDVMSLHMAPQ